MTREDEREILDRELKEVNGMDELIRLQFVKFHLQGDKSFIEEGVIEQNDIDKYVLKRILDPEF